MTIEIVLPNRIGDAILSLPAILCLKQLQDSESSKTVIYPPDRLFEIIWSLKLFNTQNLEEIIKFHSWFNPAEQSYVLDTSSRVIGLRSKKFYGPKIEAKWFTKFFQENLGCLELESIQQELPKDLVDFLQTKFGFSVASIRYFGMLLKMGYSVEQIKNTFKFSNSSLALQNELTTWEPNVAKKGYLVFCMEAAYGTKREAKRRWEEENYFKLAEKIYKDFQLLSVFVGVEKTPALPKQMEKFSLDLRGKLTILQLAQLLIYSAGYIGNDTGPLHIANLMKVPSVCIYLSTAPETFGPIFPTLNHPVLEPTIDTVYTALAQMINQ